MTDQQTTPPTPSTPPPTPQTQESSADQQQSVFQPSERAHPPTFYTEENSSLDRSEEISQISAPGEIAPLSKEESLKYEGRSTNHSFYIDYKDSDTYNSPAARTAIKKNYPKPGEGSSGTGEYPPKYIDTVGLRRQREEQAANTEELED